MGVGPLARWNAMCRCVRATSTEVGGYLFTLRGVSNVTGPNYMRGAWDGRGHAQRSAAATMHPEKRIYRVQQNPMTEAAIDTGSA
jgi:cytochrome c-type biogenesis protein CcmF